MVQNVVVAAIGLSSLPCSDSVQASSHPTVRWRRAQRGVVRRTSALRLGVRVERGDVLARSE